ncbi:MULTISPECIES: hypothetical protein [Kitasatospora]|uniref:Secreted protein n=1 Tax=Kitasatospora cystarginea TaxID=58350 RepID=A0ABN3ESD2_9ACTN
MLNAVLHEPGSPAVAAVVVMAVVTVVAATTALAALAAVTAATTSEAAENAHDDFLSAYRHAAVSPHESEGSVENPVALGYGRG